MHGPLGAFRSVERGQLPSLTTNTCIETSAIHKRQVVRSGSGQCSARGTTHQAIFWPFMKGILASNGSLPSHRSSNEMLQA